MKKKLTVCFTFLLIMTPVSLLAGGWFSGDFGRLAKETITGKKNHLKKGAKEVVRGAANYTCGSPFITWVSTVYSACTVDHGIGSGYGNLGKAREILIKNGFFSRDDFKNVSFKWCKPLGLGADGMVPQPDVIIMDREYRHSDAETLAVLIGHEMVHVKQIRKKGFGTFSCQYSGEILEGKGTSCESRSSRDGNCLECEAYRYEDKIVSKLFSGVHYSKPTYRGARFDATTWEWDGKNRSEKEENRAVATELCRMLGHNDFERYSIVKGQEKGTYRLHRDGRVEWCDFCQWYIGDLYCE